MIMRWKSKAMTKEDEGLTRTVRKFLLLPRCQSGTWYWLETVSVLQKVVEMDVGGSMDWGNYAYKWVDWEIVEV